MECNYSPTLSKPSIRLEHWWVISSYQFSPGRSCFWNQCNMQYSRENQQSNTKTVLRNTISKMIKFDKFHEVPLNFFSENFKEYWNSWKFSISTRFLGSPHNFSLCYLSSVEWHRYWTWWDNHLKICNWICFENRVWIINEYLMENTEVPRSISKIREEKPVNQPTPKDICCWLAY